MAICYHDAEGGIVQTVPGCEEPSRFQQAGRDALSWLVVLGEMSSDPYTMDRSNGGAITVTTLGGFSQPLEVRGAVGFWGGWFGEVSVRAGADVTFFGTELRAPVTVRGATVLWSYVNVVEEGQLVLRDGSTADVEDGSWSDVRSPVVDAADSELRVARLSIAGGRGAEPLIAIDHSDLALHNSEVCGHDGPAVSGSCLPMGPVYDAPACRVTRTLLRSTGDGALLDLQGPWDLERDTLVRDGAPPSAGVWGLRARPDSEVVTRDLHVWPGEGSGSGDVALDVRVIRTIDVSTWFTPPAWSRCEPAVVDPESVGFHADRIPGVYSQYVEAGWAQRYGWWWEDEYDLDGDGVADQDGVPAMWDCQPGTAAPLGPERGGGAVDEDCDGLIRCAGQQDRDGDGFPEWVEVPVGSPCPDGGDPDDSDECVPDRCGTEPTGTTPETGTSVDPGGTITGFEGTGCGTAGAGPVAAWPLVVGLLLRRRGRAG